MTTKPGSAGRFVSSTSQTSAGGCPHWTSISASVSTRCRVRKRQTGRSAATAPPGTRSLALQGPILRPALSGRERLKQPEEAVEQADTERGPAALHDRLERVADQGTPLVHLLRRPCPGRD